MNGRRVQLDVEAVLDTLKYGSFIDIVVTGIDYTGSLWPAFLVCSNGCPEDSFAAASRIAGRYSVSV